MKKLLLIFLLSSPAFARQVDVYGFNPQALPAGTQFEANIDYPDYGVHAGDTVTKLPSGIYRSDQDPGQYIATDAVEEDTDTFKMVGQ